MLFSTPLGVCGIAWRGDAVVATRLPDERSSDTARRLAARVGATEGAPPPAIRRAIAAMTALLEGEAVDLAFVSCDFSGAEPFAEAVYSRGPVRISDEGEWMPDLARGKARERALFPVLHRGEVLAVLYCDNPYTGAPLSRLTGLALFLSQAAIALENASLHRQLQSTGDGDALDDQEPRTDELTPIVPESE